MLPNPLFNQNYSTLILDQNGEILSGKTSKDGMWRFPANESHPHKLEACILAYEDQRFYLHPGIDPLAILRAIKLNFSQRKKVSGGSTITMQLARLIYKDNPRTFFYKAKEILLALRLELSFSKKEILNMYLSNAPFGGNVVGYEAASLRYFGHSASELSWGEAAALAVLPNQPAMIFPGKNENRFKEKRNFLLQKIWGNNYISDIDYQLALQEDLPQKAQNFSSLSPHLLSYAIENNPHSAIIYTTLNKRLQSQILSLLESDRKILEANKIDNACVLVLDNQKSEVLSYIGNLPNAHQSADVDIIHSIRSYGSLLKPFIYYLAISEGLILPHSLLPDYPVSFGNFVPKNFNQKYMGALPASEALYRSLNIPFVHLLKDFGIERFLFLMKKIGAKSLNKSAEHYGLSLILGGGELTPWELMKMYSYFPKTMLSFQNPDSLYFDDIYWHKKEKKQPLETWDRAAVWYTLDALKNVVRPDEEQANEYYYGKQGISWKTGTSFGNRDAWSIGFNKAFTVLIWCGNADGTGRSGHTGVKAAAPIMFHIFDILQGTTEFVKPYDNMIEIETCKLSGMKAGKYCIENIEKLWLPMASAKAQICKYHQSYVVSSDWNFRYNETCEGESTMTANFFVMPPKMEYYYQKHKPSHQSLPPLHPECRLTDFNEIDILYPRENTYIIVPVLLDGSKGSVIFEAVHKRKGAELFWFIDQKFIQKTKSEHSINISPEIGEHILYISDENGNSVQRKFVVK
jgi:penicillin-binding protein 1C